MPIELTAERIAQLKELASLDWKELNDLKQLYCRYFGYWSAEVKVFNLEIKRRKALRPEYLQAVAALRRVIKQHSTEVRRLDTAHFSMSGIYNPVTLEPVTDLESKAVNGKVAYRIAADRIKWLELEIKQLEEHIHIIQNGRQVTGITMDLLEAYNLRPDRTELLNRLDKVKLYSRLDTLKKKVYAGTSEPVPTIRQKRKVSIPVPVSNLGPRPGDYLECVGTRNYRAGAYKIVLGGVGLNRYYCRKMLEDLNPEPGQFLFAASYAGGYGHYIITVPRACIIKEALNYEFNKDGKKVGYYTARGMLQP